MREPLFRATTKHANFNQFRVYTEVKEFVISCLEFSRDLQLTQTELDETVREAIIKISEI